MTFWEIAGTALLLVFALYVGTRVASAAYFKSKQDHEKAMKGAAR